MDESAGLGNRVGQTLGKCRVEGLIGSGALGAVYRAQHTTLGVPVALKVIHPSLATSPQQLDRFVKEAQLMARLSHPNVARVFDVGAEGGQRYVVMEYLEGHDLASFIRTKAPLDLKTFLHVFYSLSTGLAAVHDAGIVHRDMRPDNVVLTQGLKPVITGFGIEGQRATDAQPAFSDGNNGARHHAAYLSPEQALGADNVDRRSDVFSLGMMMFEALTGQLPQNGGEPAEQLQRRGNEDMPNVRSVNDTVVDSVAEVVDRALLRDPEARWSSATDLGHGLRDAMAAMVIKPKKADTDTAGVGNQTTVERRRILPKAGTEPIATTVDKRFSDLHALLRAVEESKTGLGVMVIHYDDGTDFLLFADRHAKAAFRWDGELPTEISLDDVLLRHEEADQGMIDSFAVNETYYRILSTTLRGDGSIRGMRGGFVDLIALIQHLLAQEKVGVLRIEHQGRIAMIDVRKGAPLTLLVDTWLTQPSKDGSKNIRALHDAVAARPESSLTFSEHASDGLATGRLLTSEPPLSAEQIESLASFLGDAFRTSGQALKKQFGLGTRPVLEKHHRFAQEQNPAVLEEVQLEEDFGIDPEIFFAQVDLLARTGQRSLVLSAAQLLLEGRAEAIEETLGDSKRKKAKVVADLLAVWKTAQPGLEHQELAQPFAELFASLGA